MLNNQMVSESFHFITGDFSMAFERYIKGVLRISCRYFEGKKIAKKIVFKGIPKVY